MWSSLLLGAGVLLTSEGRAATFVIENADDPAVGLNDEEPRDPEGGNNGLTAGEQRLNVMRAATEHWGALLHSDVDIVFQLSFAPLDCDSVVVLGSAGTATLFRNFENAPFSDTWYHSALAESLAGHELSFDTPDIVAQFNAGIDTETCLPGISWYYGLDHQAAPDQIDLLAVALHEIAHGLGFSNFVDETTGEFVAAHPCVYSHFTHDFDADQAWPALDDAGRASSAYNTRRVAWSGAAVRAAVPSFLEGGAPTLSFSPDVAGLSYVVDDADFGPRVKDQPVSAPLALATPADGCSAISGVEGKVALLERGGCGFSTKVSNVEQAGGLAALIHNLEAGSPPGVMLGTANVGIPALRLTEADGLLLRAALAQGELVASLGDSNERYGAGPNDFALLYAPDPVRPGSSLSHFDTEARRQRLSASTPGNLLLEPAITSGLRDVDLTLALLEDVGWLTESECGNSVVGGDEQCDDGNRMNLDGCSAQCVSEFCGDGQVAPTEECDDGSANADAADTCRSNCQLPSCGDGIEDSDEECDDNNAQNADGCSASCELELCGDGTLDSAESCDDGALNSDVEANRCRSDCQLPSCGDGVEDSGEQCDLAAQNSDTLPDGCRTSCVLAQCGDGVQDSDEQCDNGALNHSLLADRCRQDCRAPRCGDQVVDSGEQCDDGNTLGGDACDAACRLERCGDGTPSAGEQCDDGNNTDNDGCSAACRSEFCGDGVQNGPEQCDAGLLNSNVLPDRCRPTCVAAHCGDAVLDSGEHCDDGNAANGDGCSATCNVEVAPEPDVVPEPETTAEPETVLEPDVTSLPSSDPPSEEPPAGSASGNDPGAVGSGTPAPSASSPSPTASGTTDSGEPAPVPTASEAPAGGGGGGSAEPEPAAPEPGFEPSEPTDGSDSESGGNNETNGSEPSVAPPLEAPNPDAPSLDPQDPNNANDGNPEPTDTDTALPDEAGTNGEAGSGASPTATAEGASSDTLPELSAGRDAGFEGTADFGVDGGSAGELVVGAQDDGSCLFVACSVERASVPSRGWALAIMLYAMVLVLRRQLRS